jgi:23S rRNA pseudouridine1911/1915/1917 synthase
MHLTPPTAETPLLPWLLNALAPMNRTRVKQLLQSGRVRVNDSPITRHDHPVKPGDRIEIAREGVGAIREPGSKQGEITILVRDDDVIAIDKPATLLPVATETQKEDTAFVRLNAHLAQRRAGRAFVVHRLDRETSGVLLFARNPETRDKLQADWEQVEKTYLAIVEGRPNPPAGTVENFLVEGKNLRVRAVSKDVTDAKRAVTDYRVLMGKANLSLVRVELKTGRKHQIRVHLAGLGCPIIGDKVYGSTSNLAGRMGLHAWRLAFNHPTTRDRVEVEAPYPAQLARVLNLPSPSTK